MHYKDYEPESPLLRAAFRSRSGLVIDEGWQCVSSIDSFLMFQSERGRTSSTLEQYEGVLARWVSEVVQARSLDAIEPAECHVWARRVRTNRARDGHAEPATIRRNVAVLKSLYKYLTARGVVAQDLGHLLYAPTQRHKQPTTIGDEAWIHAYVSSEPMHQLLLGMGMFLGLRRTEMADLRDEHVDRTRQRLVGFPRKGGGDDTLPYGELLDTWHALMPELRSDHWRTLFDATTHLPELKPDGVGVRIKRAAGGAFTPHSLRRSFVSNLVRCGVPIAMIARLANHSDIGTTLGYVKSGGGELAEWRTGRFGRTDWRT